MLRLIVIVSAIFLIVACSGDAESVGIASNEATIQFVRNLQLSFHMPTDYSVLRMEKEGDVYHYIVPPDKHDLKARWLIYKGAFPKYPDMVEKRSSGTLSGLPVQWNYWKETGDRVIHYWMTEISEQDIQLPGDEGRERPDITFQFWVWGTDLVRVNELKSYCEKLNFKNGE